PRRHQPQHSASSSHSTPTPTFPLTLHDALPIFHHPFQQRQNASHHRGPVVILPMRESDSSSICRCESFVCKNPSCPPSSPPPFWLFIFPLATLTSGADALLMYNWSPPGSGGSSSQARTSLGFKKPPWMPIR